ncbi:MAG: 3-oxoacyl-[acyl-carrier protein] reductase [Pseudonocardiales bacterium]|nr:3-oxoacyl-[acyl-carrier protein] reductase [Pseudonocardiales bacterium]
MELGLAGAATCVTGGTRGLGRAVAELLAAEGARVAVLGRSVPALDDTVAALRSRGAADAVGLVADLTDPGAVTAAFARLDDRWGELNALVNAAGPSTQRLRWYEIPDADWQDCFTLGALAPVRVMRAALPLLRAAEWARIVNIGAMSTRHPSCHRAAYTAAKAALAMLTKQVSIDLAPEQILVNTVSPGAMLTERLRARLDPGVPGVDVDDAHAVMDWMREHSGFAAQTGRIGLPSEVAALVLHLASPANSYVTGADVNADGGSLFR